MIRFVQMAVASIVMLVATASWVQAQLITFNDR